LEIIFKVSLNIIFADIWKIEMAQQQLLGAKKLVNVNLLTLLISFYLPLVYHESTKAVKAHPLAPAIVS
jgi:hypothetical protein